MTRLLTILGPTASGKSAVAMALARRLEGEIVSCDSMQVYRELDIGTAKPTPAEQAEIPHHLIDILGLSEQYSAATFLHDADRIIRAVIDRGRQPILCGGTGLYARALLYGFNMWPSDKDVAAEVRRDFDERGEDWLRRELTTVAPEFVQHLDENPRHWLRALEVVRITGHAPDLQDDFHKPDYAAPEYILMPSPETTRARIRRRSAAMLQNGWLEEAKQIGEERFRASPTAAQALGYSLVFDYLSGGIPDLDQLTEKIVIATARYAKRQRTWFRHQHPDAIMIPVEPRSTVQDLAGQILTSFAGSDPAAPSG